MYQQLKTKVPKLTFPLSYSASHSSLPLCLFRSQGRASKELSCPSQDLTTENIKMTRCKVGSNIRWGAPKLELLASKGGGHLCHAI